MHTFPGSSGLYLALILTHGWETPPNLVPENLPPATLLVKFENMPPSLLKRGRGCRMLNLEVAGRVAGSLQP